MRNLFITVLATSLIGCAAHQHEDVYESYDDSVIPIYFDARHKHVVEFEYDSAELPFDAAEVVEPHVRYLLEHPDVLVALQGNASSEGGKLYNYQLGLKRAEAVKSLMLELGITEDRISVLSIGENRAEFTPNRSVIISY